MNPIHTRLSSREHKVTYLHQPWATAASTQMSTGGSAAPSGGRDETTTGTSVAPEQASTAESTEAKESKDPKAKRASHQAAIKRYQTCLDSLGEEDGDMQLRKELEAKIATHKKTISELKHKLRNHYWGRGHKLASGSSPDTFPSPIRIQMRRAIRR